VIINMKQHIKNCKTLLKWRGIGLCRHLGCWWTWSTPFSFWIQSSCSLWQKHDAFS